MVDTAIAAIGIECGAREAGAIEVPVVLGGRTAEAEGGAETGGARGDAGSAARGGFIKVGAVGTRKLQETIDKIIRIEHIASADRADPACIDVGDIEVDLSEGRVFE